MTKIEIATLRPMSRQQMVMEKYHNTRRATWCQLWFVDGLGKTHMLMLHEIQRFGLDAKYPEYIKHDMGIYAVNARAAELAAQAV